MNLLASAKMQGTMIKAKENSLIKFMHFNLELYLVMNVDNKGAIYLANNYPCGPSAKHIDTCTHFIRKLCIEYTLKLLFIKSENNYADIFTNFAKKVTKYSEL